MITLNNTSLEIKHAVKGGQLYEVYFSYGQLSEIRRIHSTSVMIRQYIEGGTVIGLLLEQFTFLDSNKLYRLIM